MCAVSLALQYEMQNDTWNVFLIELTVVYHVSTIIDPLEYQVNVILYTLSMKYDLYNY